MPKGFWAAFELNRFIKGLASPLFLFCFFSGFLGMLLPGARLPRTYGAAVWFICAPFLEELTWRAIIQNEISRWLPEKKPVSRANLVASGLFALAHVCFNPTALSALTFFPSLCFGALWSKFHSLWLCGVLHLWYNLALRI